MTNQDNRAESHTWPVFIYLFIVPRLLKICTIQTVFIYFSSIFLTFNGVQTNIHKYFPISSWKILFSVTAPYIQPLGSPGPRWAEEVIKQDAKALLSDSRDTDLLFLISDGFYLPDKCQKYHSPSTITLAPQPTFPPPLSCLPSSPLPSLWTVNGRAPSETSAILQLSVKPWYRRELTARLNP